MWYLIYSLFHTTAIERRWLSDITGPGDWVRKLLVHIIFARLRTRRERIDRLIVIFKYLVGVSVGVFIALAFVRPSGFWGMEASDRSSFRKSALQLFVVIMGSWFYVWTGTRYMELKRKMSREDIADSGLKSLADESAEIELLVKQITVALAVTAFVAFM